MALVPLSIKKEDLTTEIVVANESSPVADDIEAEVHFILNGENVSTSKMEKNVEDVTKQTSSEVSKETGTLKTYFDYFCIGVLGVLIFIKISVALTPPKQ